MTGIGGGAFWPEEPISREQICVAMANYAGLTYSGSSGTFADDSSIHDWAKEASVRLPGAGAHHWHGQHTFAPQDPAQRAQACAGVLNAYDAGCKFPSISKPAQYKEGVLSMGGPFFLLQTRPASIWTALKVKIMYTSFMTLAENRILLCIFRQNPPIMQTILQIMYAIVRNS